MIVCSRAILLDPVGPLLIETKRADIQQLDKYRLGCRMIQDIQTLLSSQLKVNGERQDYGGSDRLYGYGELIKSLENSTWRRGGCVRGGRMRVELCKPVAGHERQQIGIDPASYVFGNVEKREASGIQGCTIGSGIVSGKIRPGSISIISCDQIFEVGSVRDERGISGSSRAWCISRVASEVRRLRECSGLSGSVCGKTDGLLDGGFCSYIVVEAFWLTRGGCGRLLSRSRIASAAR